MKGDLTRAILEAIDYSAKNAADVFYAITRADFPASQRKLEYLARHHGYLRSLKEKEGAAMKRYCSLLYKLKRDGLIISENRGTSRLISITERGVEKLRNFKELPSSGQYQKQEGGAVIIVAFDVPERRKKQRDWLRATLKRLGYQMIQKSVWAGTIKIPEAFIQDLRQQKLIDNVEILSVVGGRLKDVLRN